MDNSSLPSSPCPGSTWSVLMSVAFSVAHLLLVLPLFAAVLCLGCRRRRPHSHADVLAYHVLVTELIMVSGSVSYCAGAYADLPNLTQHGLDVIFSIWSTKIHFHTLTCVEQYLAAVHPVAYLGLRKSGGARVRNLGAACVWLCFACGMTMALASDVADTVVYYCLVAVALVVVCFCCTSVLCVLRRPGPGRRGQADQTKRRAACTILTVMAALLLSLGGMLVGGAVSDALQPQAAGACVAVTSEVWFSLPGSLVSPLLYLHRAGNLPGCKHGPESPSGRR